MTNGCRHIAGRDLDEHAVALADGRKTTLDLSFHELGAADFRYGYFQDNVKSKKIAEHFGFVYDRSEEIVRPWDGALKKIDSCLLTRERYEALNNIG